MRNRVLNDQPCNPLRERLRKAKANRATIVLHEQGIALQSKPLDEAHDDLGKVIECVAERLRGRRAGMPKPRQVRRNQPESARQPLEQRLIHARRRRKPMEQQDDGGRPGAGITIEDGETIDIHRDVCRRGANGCVGRSVHVQTADEGSDI